MKTKAFLTLLLLGLFLCIPTKAQNMNPNCMCNNYELLGVARSISYLPYDNEHGFRAFFRRSDFPILTVGENYTVYIQFNDQTYANNYGDKFEFTGNSLSYDGYNIDYITSDGYYYDEDMDETISITCPMFSTNDWIAHEATGVTIYIYGQPLQEKDIKHFQPWKNSGLFF